MSFLIQRAAGRGLTLTQISSDALRIGRGTNQELRSENPAVALEHAIIECDAAGYFVTDKGSITGTYVNGKPVESARLSKGDVVEIGDLHLEIQIADPAKPLFVRITAARTAGEGFLEDEEAPQPKAAAPGARVVKAKKIDYVSAYRLTRPWLTKLSLTAILLILALAVIGEVILPEYQHLFMPGGVSSAHARARVDCEACHQPWKSVSSAKCRDCHPQQPHGMFEANAPDCFSCHAEHRGATKLASIGDATCVGCHADLGSHMRGPRAQRASLTFANGRYPFAAIARIAAFGDTHPELAYPPDKNTLRFDHKLHLAERGVFNASGRRQVLKCEDCHSLGWNAAVPAADVAASRAATRAGARDAPASAGADAGAPAPIDFASHCQSCHRLTFDARFPKAEVPHGGDPGIVYGFVVATYSGDRDILGRPPADVRRILAARKRVSADQSAIVNAEHVIKTKCKLCHEIDRKGERLAAVPPVIPRQWLTHAKFTHGRHRQVRCETCHEGARQSAATSDVLMPRRANCTGCHASNARTAQAATPCLTCHEYHLRPQKQVLTASLARGSIGGLGSGGRMLQGILLAIIVILLLVVLVPVGIALFQRLRGERAPAVSVDLPTSKVPPVRVDIPTDKVTRQKAPPPPDLAPPPSQPVVQSTRVVTPEPPKPEAGEPVGTQMVQWYGMLHCTSGPLAGQRFVIEEEGFYIGRDPSLAKVVVADSRVSRRHLRILPRDGKVWAIDQASANGTYLREQRITEVQLKRGDALILGDNAATFVYQI